MKSKKTFYFISCILILALLIVPLSGCSPVDLIRVLSRESSATSDISGSVNGQVYKNQTAGFELTYPDGYIIMNRDEINSMYAENIEQLKDMFSDADALEQVIQKGIPVSIASKYTFGNSEEFNPSINIAINNMKTELSRDIVDYANQSANEASQMVENVSYGDVTPVRIGNTDAATADLNFTVNGYPIPEKQYFFKNKSYFIVITLSAEEENDMNELVKSIETIKFY